jgi:hypothetical protein
VNSALPPEHPDDDLLADLAADVLPTHQARAVEAHVMACGRCAGLLTDAEQVRNLLLQDDPGPMPPDVLARIDAALRTEAATFWSPSGSLPTVARTGPSPAAAPYGTGPTGAQPYGAQPHGYGSAASQPYDVQAGAQPYDTETGARQPAGRPRTPPPPPTPTQPVRVITPFDDTTTIETYEAARRRQAARRRDESAPPAASAGAVPDRARSPRLSRPSRVPSRSRRDLRQEVLDVRAGRRGTVLAAAAGVVVLLGLGGYVVVGLIGSHQSDSASSASSSVQTLSAGSAAKAGGPPVLTTGTNYTQATLAEQARSLVQQADRGVPRSAAAVKPQAAAPEAASATADAGNLTLRDPTALNGCLSALQAGGRRPVAVDLARYEGREAAIIVLNGANGGYEVWAVARDCRPGADGTITYVTLNN